VWRVNDRRALNAPLTPDRVSTCVASVAFADVLELLLDFARGAPLGLADDVGDRHMRRDFGKHVHVVLRQCAVA